MGYEEVERSGHISILDHRSPGINPYPIAIDCQYSQISLGDLEEHLADAGVDLSIFHQLLAGLG
jgi:hypothetical protein